jgi:GT2 family glycosyltransferase
MTEESKPSVSVIIPSLNGNGKRIISNLANQTRIPDEIEVVSGVRPNGRARNLGVDRTTGDVLVFIDDDALPGSQELIERMVEVVQKDEMVGVSGAARVLPRDASWFQRRVAAEIPRTINPVPKRSLETNPPIEGYGHSLITTTCCAIRRSVLEEVGPFSEDLTSGVDTDLFYRIRRAGFRFVMVSDIYVEHPAPDNLGSLWKKFYWYGLGYGQETRRYPERKMGLRLDHWFKRLLFLIAATVWLLPNIFILYSYGYPEFKLGFRPFKAFSTYAVAWGYADAWKSKQLSHKFEVQR